MKTVKLKSDAPSLFYRSLGCNRNKMWSPTKQQRNDNEMLKFLIGIELPIYPKDYIIGIARCHYIRMPIEFKNVRVGNTICIPERFCTKPTKDNPEINFPLVIEEADDSAWWKKDGLEVVRLHVIGHTLEFMGFTKSENVAK